MNAATPPSDAEDRPTSSHRRHTRRRFAKTLGHLGPALVLVGGVAPLLSGAEPLTVLRGVELLLGAAYLVLVAREIWHLRHNPFHQEAVAWLELAAAGILAIESYHIWHRHHEAELAGAAHRSRSWGRPPNRAGLAAVRTAADLAPAAARQHG